jgi:ATP-dependent protease ClpP protease subunit
MSKTSNLSDSISDIHSSNIDLENRTIYLQEKEDASSETSGVDFRMLQGFIKNINILQNASLDPITIYMQTVGGCWYSGMGIYDAIKLCKCKVNIVGYAQVCSMGTIIMQSANRRILTPNCVFMCHYGSSDNSGDYLSSQNFAVIDKNNCQTMIDIYAEKCIKGKYFKERGDPLSKVKTYIKRKMKDGDWYMTAAQAVDYGFADNIFSNSLKI